MYLILIKKESFEEVEKYKFPLKNVFPLSKEIPGAWRWSNETYENEKI